MKKVFEPWQDFTELSKEVQEARKKAPERGGEMRGEWTWRYLKHEYETREEYLKRIANQVRF